MGARRTENEKEIIGEDKREPKEKIE